MLNLVTLVLQITLVLAACRLVGGLFLKIGQPRVNGEMFAGVFLGPSLLGLVAPRISAFVFPASTLDFLNALGQLGVVIYMFMAGLEVDLKKMKGQVGATLSSSLACILAPFLLAYPLALYLYPRISSPNVNFLHFTLFLGAATSITAFPMLARILSERNMLTGRLGVVSVTCAAIAGVATWCMLAYIVMLIKRQSTMTLWETFGGIVIFGFAMFYGVQPLLRKFEASFRKNGGLNDGMMAALMVLLLAASVCTGYLGLHPLFGAFLLGVIMPKENRLIRFILARVETLTLSMLLPLFFAFSGLRTNIGMVKGGQMWLYCGIIILVSLLGKLIAPMLSAWASGMSLRESAGLGALLNTRGLISLVVFNIGLDLKIISVALFSMLVMMALVNTVLTTWLMDLFCPAKLFESAPEQGVAELGVVPAMEV